MSPSRIPENVSNDELIKKQQKPLCLLPLYCSTIIAVQKKHKYKSTYTHFVVFVCKRSPLNCLPPAYRKPVSHHAHSEKQNKKQTHKLCLPLFIATLVLLYKGSMKIKHKTVVVAVVVVCLFVKKPRWSVSLLNTVKPVSHHAHWDTTKVIVFIASLLLHDYCCTKARK